MSRWRMMVVALTALTAMPLEARAEDYPTHNVIILVPWRTWWRSLRKGSARVSR